MLYEKDDKMFERLLSLGWPDDFKEQKFLKITSSKTFFFQKF